MLKGRPESFTYLELGTDNAILLNLGLKITVGCFPKQNRKLLPGNGARR
jgi:hypothetical protein